MGATTGGPGLCGSCKQCPRKVTPGAADVNPGREVRDSARRKDGLRATEASWGPLNKAEERRLRMLQLWFGTSAEAWHLF